MKNFSIGDKVVVPFFTACQKCYDCARGQASRCEKGELFGNSAPANTIDGGQAEYVRVPLASTTLVKAPNGKIPPGIASENNEIDLTNDSLGSYPRGDACPHG